MATTEGSVSAVTEECAQCGRATRHEVHVQLLTESRRGENKEYSREPYRLSECLVCGSTSTLRMNNA